MGTARKIPLVVPTATQRPSRLKQAAVKASGSFQVKEGSIDLPGVSAILRTRISGRDISYDEPRWRSWFTRRYQTHDRDAARLSPALPARAQPVTMPPPLGRGFGRDNFRSD